MIKEKNVQKSGKKGNELNRLKILNCLGSPGKRQVRYSMNMSSCTSHREIRTALSTVAVSMVLITVENVRSSTTLSLFYDMETTLQ